MYNLIWGDSFRILPEIPSNSVDLILTDPPYDLKAEQKEFLHKEFLRICSGSILVFSPPENQWCFPGISKHLFWIKPTSTKNYSKSYGRFVEMIFCYQRGNVWNSDLQWANYTGVYHDIVVGNTEHPFEKPYSLIDRFVRIHSNSLQTVLDPFMGSGIVGVVANSLGRNFLGIENNAFVCEKAKKRIEEGKL